ncbi:hypothetical protein ILUMI_20533 [Ignelater luminosus]|uniref:PiggyBac transposable element-derived protein domain-containing protein n=1 Tax=Ignelater luminosus TaxID=2038154 RepID=A0A8K0CIA0_IGNLU|nr:hypothetical protein ILUMI_20533 [Ignelater luminosus]
MFKTEDPRNIRQIRVVSYYKHRPLTLHELLDEIEHPDRIPQPPLGIYTLPSSEDIIDEDGGEENTITINNLPKKKQLRNLVKNSKEARSIYGNVYSDSDSEDDLPLSIRKSPIELFNKFIDNEFIDIVVNYSNKYAVCKTLSGDISPEEMYAFIGIPFLAATLFIPDDGYFGKYLKTRTTN